MDLKLDENCCGRSRRRCRQGKKQFLAVFRYTEDAFI